LQASSPAFGPEFAFSSVEFSVVDLNSAVTRCGSARSDRRGGTQAQITEICTFFELYPLGTPAEKPPYDIVEQFFIEDAI
jgi:hypothetical protein